MSAAWRLRLTGLAGSVLLAMCSYRVGAVPGADPAARGPNLADPSVVAALLGALSGTGLLVYAWIAVGRDPGGTRAMWGTAALWLGPLTVAAPLGSRDVYTYAGQGAVYAAGLDPYRAGPAAVPYPWLSAVTPLWRSTPSPYGPLSVVVSGVAAAGTPPVAVIVLRGAAVLGLALLAVALPYLARAVGTDPGRALWLGLANPLVALHGVAGAHNDALLVGLLVAGLAVAVLDRPQWTIRALAAGGLLGLAGAVKVTGLLGVPFAILLLARNRRLAGTLVPVGAAAVFGAVTVAAGLGVGWLRALPGVTSPVHWLSPPSGVGLALGGLLTWTGVTARIDPTLHLVRGLAVYVGLPVALAVIWWRARGTEPRRILLGCAQALTVTVLLSPLVYPWYALAPLAVAGAARVTSRWVVPVVAGLAAVLLPDGYNLARLTMWPGAFLELALCLLWTVHSRHQVTRPARRQRARPGPAISPSSPR